MRTTLAKLKKMDLVFLALSAGFLLIHLSNLWRLEVYPFTDLPNHLAEAYLLRVLPNPAEPLRHYYDLQITLITPATLHAFFCSLFPDVETGNKVFYSLYLVILPLSLMLLVHAARGDRWIGLLAILLLYNFSMMWGFSAFTLGIGLVLVEMILLVKFLERPSARRALLLACASLALFYAHVVLLVFSAGVTAVVLLTRRGLSRRQRLLGIAALVPAGVLTGAWLIPFQAAGGEPSILSFLSSYYRLEYLPSLLHRLTGLFNDNKQLAPTPFGQLLSLGFIAPLFIGFIAFGSRNRLRNLITIDNDCKHVALVFLMLAGLSYLILPDRLPGWWYLYQRFSAFLILGVIWVTSWLIPPGSKKPVQIAVLVIVLTHAAMWFQYFSEFKEVAGPFRALLYHSSLARERTLAALIDAPDFRGRPAFIHYQNYQLVWNHGAVPSVITEYRFRLVGQKPGALPLYQEWLVNQDYGKLLDRYNGIDLLLTHGAAPLAAAVQDDRYTLVDRQGDWALLQVRSVK